VTRTPKDYLAALRPWVRYSLIAWLAIFALLVRCAGE
jgi:hypothetical protein